MQESDANDVLDGAALNTPSDFVLEEEPRTESRSSEVTQSTFEADLESQLSYADDDDGANAVAAPERSVDRPVAAEVEPQPVDKPTSSSKSKGRPGRPKGEAGKDKQKRAARGNAFPKKVEIESQVDLVKAMVAINRVSGCPPTNWSVTKKVLEEFVKTDASKKYCLHWKLDQAQLRCWFAVLKPFLANLASRASEADVRKAECRMLDAKFKRNRNTQVNTERRGLYRELLQEAGAILRS
jgi:hypothetical protein